MTSDDRAARLVRYINSLPDFEYAKPNEFFNYKHMGATLTDTMLRAGISYAVVKPRIERVQAYPEARTTDGFLKILEKESPQKLLNFKGRKPEYLLELARFLSAEGVQTEEDLNHWLRVSSNVTRLKQLRGVGDGTVDYLKLATGLQATAVGSRLIRFLEIVGIQPENYEDAGAIIRQTANLLKTDTAVLDYSMWHYMDTHELS